MGASRGDTVTPTAIPAAVGRYTMDADNDGDIRAKCGGSMSHHTSLFLVLVLATVFICPTTGKSGDMPKHAPRNSSLLAAASPSYTVNVGGQTVLASRLLTLEALRPADRQMKISPVPANASHGLTVTRRNVLTNRPR